MAIEGVLCPVCGKDANYEWDGYNDPDSPNEDIPRWAKFTTCCNALVGQIYCGRVPPDKGEVSAELK